MEPEDPAWGQKLLGEDGIPNKSDKGHRKGLGWEDFEHVHTESNSWPVDSVWSLPLGYKNPKQERRGVRLPFPSSLVLPA